MFPLSNEASSSINLNICAGNIVNVSELLAAMLIADCCVGFINVHLLFQHDKVRRKKKFSHLCVKLFTEFLYSTHRV